MWLGEAGSIAFLSALTHLLLYISNESVAPRNPLCKVSLWTGLNKILFYCRVVKFSRETVNEYAQYVVRVQAALRTEYDN